MKKAALLLIVFTFVLSFAPAAFAQETASTQSLAQYFSAESVFYVAVRSDDAYLDQLDSLLGIVTRAPGVNFPPISVRSALNMALADENAPFTLEQARTWVGDAIAIASDSLDDSGTPANAYAVVDITERSAAVDFFSSVLPGSPAPEEQGGYSIFDAPDGGVIAVADDVLVIAEETALLPELPLADSLAAKADFVNAVDALPADGYNVLGYIELAAVPQDNTSDIPFDITKSGPLAFGFVTLDSRSLVIDSAQLAGENAMVASTPVDPGFARYVPGDSSAVIHATDLTSLYTSLMSFVTIANAQSGSNDDPAAQIEAGLGVVGIDLQEDILSWTTGDYALFLRTDALPLINEAIQTGRSPAGLSDAFDFGFVIEATDPEKARAFADQISLMLSSAITAQETEQASTSEETINGTDVTVISLQIPLDVPSNTLPVDLLIGANDEVFFIATRASAELILSGEKTLADSVAYADAAGYLLPNPSTVWLTDGEGFLVTVGGSLLSGIATGPAMGSTFDGIAEELNSGGTSPKPAQQGDPFENLTPEQGIELIEYFINTISSSSLSSTVTEDGTVLVRLVLSTVAR